MSASEAARRWARTHTFPHTAGGVVLADGGGRVNDLVARPLLNRFHPAVAAGRQPLAGEFAARRELLVELPFFTGYGVEIGLLIDAYQRLGLDGLAQVDLGVRPEAPVPSRDERGGVHRDPRSRPWPVMSYASPLPIAVTVAHKQRDQENAT